MLLNKVTLYCKSNVQVKFSRYSRGLYAHDDSNKQYSQFR